MATVIIGAGIVGLSTAYYLSEDADLKPSDIHIVEFSSELFASASGQAGGYLQRGQFGRDLASLGDLSFALHEKLALNHDGATRWGYTRTTRMALDVREGGFEDDSEPEGSGGLAPDGTAFSSPQWLRRSLHRYLQLDANDDAAQVDPKRLCDFLLSTCTSRGVHLHQPATVDSVSLDPSGNPSTASIRTSTGILNLECTRVLIAAGPWTPRVLRTLFPQCKTYLPISPYAGHSLLLRSPRWKVGASDAVALFASGARGFSSEIYARTEGELYLAGANSRTMELPARPTERVLDPASLTQLRRTAERLCGLKVRMPADGSRADSPKELPKGSEGLEILRESLCFRPITPLGRPVIDKLDVGGAGAGPSKVARHGVWAAAGHGVWGITLGLGTGLVVAQLMQGKEPSASVRACRVGEFANLY